jgi:hypothetical protein
MEILMVSLFLWSVLGVISLASVIAEDNWHGSRKKKWKLVIFIALHGPLVWILIIGIAVIVSFLYYYYKLTKWVYK